MDQNDFIIQLRKQGNEFLAQAAALQDKAEALFKNAAILEDGKKREQEFSPLEDLRRKMGAPAAKPTAPKRADRGTRILQVRSALRFGSLTRSELQRATRIPKGTPDHLLKPDGEFEKDGEGRYSIKKKPYVAALGAMAAQVQQTSLDGTNG